MAPSKVLAATSIPCLWSSNRHPDKDTRPGGSVYGQDHDAGHSRRSTPAFGAPCHPAGDGWCCLLQHVVSAGYLLARSQPFLHASRRISTDQSYHHCSLLFLHCSYIANNPPNLLAASCLEAESGFPCGGSLWSKAVHVAAHLHLGPSASPPVLVTQLSMAAALLLGLSDLLKAWPR
jgi:hypothetical protein